MNRAELMEISRKAVDGTQAAENILTYCRTEAEEGRGLANYSVGTTPSENVLNILRSRGLDVTYNSESMVLVCVWDQEREDAYQAEREAARDRNWGGPRRGSVSLREWGSTASGSQLRATAEVPQYYFSTSSTTVGSPVEPIQYSPPEPQQAQAQQQSGSTEASGSISGAIGGVVGWLR